MHIDFLSAGSLFILHQADDIEYLWNNVQYYNRALRYSIRI